MQQAEIVTFVTNAYDKCIALTRLHILTSAGLPVIWKTAAIFQTALSVTTRARPFGVNHLAAYGVFTSYGANWIVDGRPGSRAALWASIETGIGTSGPMLHKRFR